MRTHRRRLGLTQEELALRGGVSRQTIISVESGMHVPTLTFALTLAKLLGTTIDELFWLDPSAGR